MMRRLVTLLLLAAIALALIALAVANRKVVSVSLDPFNQSDPALVFSPPLYLLVLGALILGVLIGGSATWLRQGKWRARARRSEAEARALRAQMGAPTPVPAVQPGERLRLIVPPPAA